MSLGSLLTRDSHFVYSLVAGRHTAIGISVFPMASSLDLTMAAIRVTTLLVEALATRRSGAETHGLIGAIIDVETNRKLGCTFLSVEAGDMLGSLQMAMIARLPLTSLRDAVVTHPTMVEGFNNLFAGT